MIYVVIIIVAIATRFVPHMPNLVPITAIAIFSAVYLPQKQAIAIPIIVRLISDLFLGFFAWPLMIAVYVSHLIGVGVGLWIKNAPKGHINRWIKICSAGFISAICFFLITNFVMFYPGMYAQNLSGLIHSYVNALPFFRGTLIGDVGYTVVLFGAYELARYTYRLVNLQRLKSRVIDLLSWGGLTRL